MLYPVCGQHRINDNSCPALIDLEQVQQEVKGNEELQAIVQKLKVDSISVATFSWEQGILLYKGRLVMSHNSRFILALLTTFHDSVLGGHSRFLRTYK